MLEAERLGLDSYLPMMRRRVHRENQPWRSGERLVPLFPSYLFVRFQIEDSRWRVLTQQRGVRRFLGPTESPTPVAEWFMAELLLRGVETDPQAIAATRPIERGARVRIIDGKWVGLSGVCQWSSEQRVDLLLKMFGRDNVRVRMDRSAVELAA